MKLLYSTLLGYLLGNISPAALVGRLKKVDLREEGSKNLGGTNTMLVIGRGWGITVMLLDIFKGFLSSRLARWLFPHVRYAALAAGLGAVVGHIFPATMHFRGGKGVAALGGMILAYHPGLFLLLGVTGILLMLLTNVSVVGPMSAAILFPLLVLLHSRDCGAFLICAIACGLVIFKHRDNIRQALDGEKINVRHFCKNGLKEN